MGNWRDTILKNFKPKISRLTLVADPDGLLSEERMLSAIKDRGFDLISFDDPIAFRYAYEAKYRSVWDKGQESDLVVVLRSEDQHLSKLPFDLLKAGRQIVLALHQLFPKLNYPVIACLDREYLDAVDEAYQQHDGNQLTERETKEFVLMHCFGMVPKLIKTPVQLLKELLSLHSCKVRLPEFLAEHMLESLAKEAAFATWPLADILISREKFLRFLQDEWKNFLASFSDNAMQSRVPFSHEDVRAYIDTFFLDGLLTPMEWDDVIGLPAWVMTGVAHDPKVDAVRRFRGLREKFESTLPIADAPHKEWQQAAQRWAELVTLRWEWDDSLDDADRTGWETLHTKVEVTFGQWMMARYGSLHNLPYKQQPVMVHQIARFMASERNQKKLPKVALLVMDGLSLDQWLLLRRHLEANDKGWRFQESTAFAWVPTLTSVTRQSIFAGEPPFFFPTSFETTSKEKTHWLRFWEDHGVKKNAVELVSNIKGVDDADLELALNNPHLSVLGIIWNRIDNFVHSSEKTSSLHLLVNEWIKEGHLQKLLMRLYKEGFVVYLTADHGNVAATGIGNPREGVLVETKGQRVRIYDRTEFLEEVASQFPSAMRWPNYGLPPERHVLLAGNLKAFSDVGEEIVSHGGIAIEEVLVPFVAITREDA
ncbi:MAG: BREX-3 system phosphatase PglZ [Planctomycetota bacterium]|nr:MAG: BREX-3 system phosphatase PglZ [Planctomycetota bacterium]